MGVAGVVPVHAGGSQPAFVGRAAELAALADAVSAAVVGHPRLVVVRGDAGIGKTRLVEEAATRARAGGVRVLTGGGMLLAEALPYAALLQAFRQDAGIRALLTTPADDPAESWSRPLVFEALLDAVSALAGQAPLMLVIEDAQWLDDTTRDVLTFLVSNLHDAGVVLVVTARDDLLSEAARDWLTRLCRHRDAAVIRLAGLAPAEVEQLVAAPYSGALARSDGNPFLALELASSGAAIPESLVEALGSRLVALDPDVHEVLRAVAVTGQPLDHDVLAEVVDLPEERLTRALRAAVDARLLEVTGAAYRFRQGLLAEVVYAEMLPGERRARHRRLAQALAAASPAGRSELEVATEIAEQWHRGRDLPHGVPAALRAARVAMRTRAFPEAWRHFERVVEGLGAVEPVTETAPALLLEAAEAARWAGHAGRAVELAGRALELLPQEDRTARAVAHERLGRYLWDDGRIEESLLADAEASRCLEGEPASQLGARVLAAHAAGLMVTGRYAESATLARRAVSVAHDVGAAAEEGYALATLGVDLAAAGQADEALTTLAAARRLALAGGSLEDVLRAAANTAFVLGWLGRLDEAIAAAYDGITAASAFGAPAAATAMLANNAAAFCLQLGRWDEGARLVAEGLRDGAGRMAPYLRLLGMELAVARGDDAAFADLAAELGATAADARLDAPIAATTAEHALWRGDAEAGLTVATDALAALGAGAGAGAEAEAGAGAGAGAGAAVDVRARLVAVAVRAAADAAELAALRRDERRVERLRRTAPDVPDGAELVPEAAAWAALADAERTRLDGASDPAAWGQAAARWSDFGNVACRAYALWRQAEAYLPGDRRRATRALREAAVLVRDLPDGPQLRACTALARRARLTLDLSHAASDTASAAARAAGRGEEVRLTDRERAVLALVAQGRTNRQIGAALYMSEKTASVHVSNILGKMGVRNRAEAAAAAQRLGLVPHEGG